MALLKADVNSQIGDSAFADKKKHYKKPAFVLTQDVAKAARWTTAEITKRQEHLALIAVQTWPLFY